ncbi:ABC transporter permease [Sphingobacterium sp. LRF_L2]|uniref:ABC transporter permease n=1 Tax=Sphingobacterium sp. LRF_L2 TaxID=3369421 RepID=UPI003F5DEDE2
MVKNYLTIAWRNLLKNKGYSTINILGLAMGLACCLLIVLYIQDELSFDQYHTNKDRIYRVVHTSKETNTLARKEIWGNAPIGTTLKADFPEIEKITQFSGQASILFKYKEKAFQEERVFFMDSTAFQVFSWKVLAGDPTTALTAPYSAVLTKSTAQKYFGNENAIGKTLDGGLAAGRANEGIYTVKAIIEDIPSNSHFTFDALLSMSTFKKNIPELFEAWGYVDFYTYILVGEKFDLNQFRKKIPDFLKRTQAFAEDKYTFDLEPLSQAYLHSDASRQPGVTGNMQNLYIFSIIAVFILAIACVNFMNLATSRSMERAKEVGVRKVVGASRSNLIIQFMSESLMLVALSAVLAIVIVLIVLPFMETFTGKQLTWLSLIQLNTVFVFSGIVLITGILAASYPALILARFKPVKVLHGKRIRSGTTGSNLLRKTLVIFQFSLSIALIAGTLIVFSQLTHLQHQDLGFQTTQRLVIDFNFDEKIRNSLEAVKKTFADDKDVLSVSASRTVPGTFFPNAYTEIESAEGKMMGINPSLFEVDIDFIPSFHIALAAGRAYSRDFPTDTAHAMVINEAAARVWGYADPKDIIGKRFSQWGQEGQIIGVVKDFNYLSLHSKVEPLALRLEPGSSRYLTIEVKQANMVQTLERLSSTWSKIAPHRPFLYSFLDQNFNKQYEADFRFRTLFSAFSSFALFIACLGLLGLATYTAQQRIKEIGIRKVLGASVFELISLLSFDFLKLVIIAIVISIPIAWWAMGKWLENFAYHIRPEWWMFTLAGACAVGIAILTVSFQAFKAANTNPVHSLRNE